MPEKVNDKTIFSLLEVTKSIQKTLSDRYASSFWVKAEMNKLNHYKHSGHCYPELVEKENGKVIAQIKSCLWKDDYQRANNNFQAILKEPLKDGIKILFLAKIAFDPSHGLSLWIMDIDPSYTLGDLERERQETIKKLQEEGIFDSNRTLKLPLLPQRIAIISVETSKGYADFLKVLKTNSWNYQFFDFLFPSLLQGDKAVAAICQQLKRIKKVKDHFDVVAIIRGGGGDVGLSCYNNYQLAKEIAMFPIPVISGIGHATNETVSEMVSFYNAITPTKLAEYVLQKFHNFAVPVQEAERKIQDKSRRLISEEKTKFQSEVKLFRSLTENILLTNQNEIVTISRSIIQHSSYIFKNQKEHLFLLRNGIVRGAVSFCRSQKQEIKQYAVALRKDVGAQMGHFKLIISQLRGRLGSQSLVQCRHTMRELDSIEKNVNNMSPYNVLKRGYSITMVNGKVVKEISQVSENDVLKTTLHEGNIVSIVKSTDDKADDE